MPASRSSIGNASLAGWLFADLALILAFVFLDSSASGSEAGAVRVTSTSTSTTVADTGKGNALAQGVRPRPIEIHVKFNMKTPAKELIARVEQSLREQESGGERSREFLVITAYAGTRGVSRSLGQLVARRVAAILENDWSRVRKGRTYFQLGDAADQPFGTVQFKLFPVNQQ